MQYKKNPDLKTIKKGYPGNSIKKGRFLNEYTSPIKFSLWNAFKNSVSRSEKEKELRREKHTTPVLHLEKLPTKNEDSIVWLGHNSFLFTLNKKRIILDPQLSSYFFMKRKNVLPCSTDILTNIDYLVITHTHRDHLDKPTIKKIKASKNAKALLPLGVGKYIRQWNKNFATQEAGWWQQYTTTDFEVFFLPAKHWSNRILLDTNKSLWGSFIFRTKNKTIFFCGDSALTKHFKDIHKYFPNIDICIMPIGAYEPPEIMQSNHMSPDQSVKAFNIMHGKEFIPSHYGTFVLSDDSTIVSLKRLRDEISKHKDKKKLCVPAIGEVIYF